MTEDQERLFSEAFDAHYSAVLRFCRRRLANLEDAADAASGTFMTAWRRIDDFSRVEYQRAWLFQVARLTMANQRRSNRRSGELNAKIGRLASNFAPDAAEIAVSASEIENAMAALRKLPESDQEIIGLAAFESLGHEEIAVTLDITPGQARSRLYRARQRLRREFGRRPAT